MTLATQPKLLITDDPTTALNGIIQSQVLELMMELREQISMPILFIILELGMIGKVADNVTVIDCETHVKSIKAGQITWPRGIGKGEKEPSTMIKYTQS